MIFNRTCVFKTSLKEWNAQTAPTISYKHIKTFIRDEHAALEMVGGLIMKDSLLNQANFLQIIQSQNEELTGQFQRDIHEAFQTYVMSNAQEVDLSGHMDSLSNEITSMTSNISSKNDSSEKNILYILQQMMTKINTLENQVKAGNQSRNPTRNANPNSTKNPKTGKAWRRYC